MQPKLTSNFIENASLILYYLRRGESDPLGSATCALSRSYPEKDKRILRTFEAMLKHGLVRIEEVVDKVQNIPSLVSAVKNYSTQVREKDFIDYVQKKKNITIHPFVSIGDMFDSLSLMISSEITRISNSDDVNDSILVYYGDTLAKFAEEVHFTEQAKKDAARILSKRNNFSIIVPTIGNIALPKISPQMFNILHEKSSNTLASRLSAKLYNDTNYNLVLITQQAFLCSPDILAGPVIQEVKKKWFSDTKEIMPTFLKKPKNFLFSLGPTASLDPEQKSSFQEIYNLYYPSIFERRYWQDNVKAELLGRLYNDKGEPIGKEDPNSEEFNDKLGSELSSIEMFQNLNYLNLGISIKQLRQISSYYFEQSKSTPKHPLPMGACAIISGSSHSIDSKAESAAVLIHKGNEHTAPLFNKLFCLDYSLKAIQEKLLSISGEYDAFMDFKRNGH